MTIPLKGSSSSGLQPPSLSPNYVSFSWASNKSSPHFHSHVPITNERSYLAAAFSSSSHRCFLPPCLLTYGVQLIRRPAMQQIRAIVVVSTGPRAGIKHGRILRFSLDSCGLHGNLGSSWRRYNLALPVPCWGHRSYPLFLMTRSFSQKPSVPHRCDILSHAHKVNGFINNEGTFFEMPSPFTIDRTWE